jgi:hypothetical protein
MNVFSPELKEQFADPVTRISSGLYKIIVKSSEAYDGKTVIPFRPNPAQIRLIENLHNRNLILKSRQLGFSTLVAIMWLDHALFEPNQRCGIVAQDRETAESIFRDKVKFAYDNLPAAMREVMPLAKDSASELLFAHNNSSLRVATSLRGSTIHRLHVSEFAKICAKYPEKANEVITGSLPAVPLDGIAVIESTAEGQGGHFYELCKRAQELEQQGAILTERDWQLHFYPWHMAEEYQLDPTNVVITPKEHEYFDKVEGETSSSLNLRQRAWYTKTKNSDFAGDPERMFQEYPSTVEEPFAQSTEGTYYAIQLATARRDGRISRVPHVSNVPVNTFWDIGSRDGTAIWFHQRVGAEHRFIAFDEAWGEPYGYFIQRMQSRGWIWGTHFLPHDATHKRQQGARVASPIEMLEELAPGWRFQIVPRVDDVLTGIQMARAKFSQAWFDEANCAAGIAHLALYRKEWNDRLAVWSDRPRHDEHSEAADAFRQWAQGWEDYSTSSGSVPKRRNTSGWAV